MIVEIIILIVGIVIGVIVDRILFGVWHKGAHSNKLREEEAKQKEIELEERESTDILYLKPEEE